MLIRNQSKIVENMFLSIGDKKLYNIPTGTGKTYIFLALAKKITLEMGKKVIISTSTNQLVREFYSISQNHTFCFEKDSVKIEIGKSNYIDYELYLFHRNNNNLNQYIEESSLEEYDNFILNRDREQLFFDSFEKIVKYKDIAFNKIVSSFLAKKTSSNKPFNNSISISNHYFLLSTIRSVKEDFFEDHVVLMDETHLIGEIAQNILSNNFSLFSTKISLGNIGRELSQGNDFVGKVAIKKNIDTLNVLFSKILQSYSKKESVDRLADKDSTDIYMQKIFALKESKNIATIKKQLLKRKESINVKEVEIFLSEINTINGICNSYKVNSEYIDLSYTPSRGYPLLTSFSENPLGYLNRILWGKLKYFVGVSATICPSFEPTTKELNYALGRLGMHGEGVSIEFHEKFFSKNLVKVKTPDAKTPEYTNIYESGFDIENDNYREYIIDYIHKNHDDKNSIIFCGGYKEAEVLSELYKRNYDDANIHRSNKMQTSTQTLEGFKKTGGLLFATRDYGVGISLKGKLLENIFVLRLPYPVTVGFHWQMLRKKSKNIFMASIKYEMLISLMQLLGRLQRSEKDGGNIYLLDKRYLTNIPLKKKIDKILSYYGVIIDNSKSVKEKATKISAKEREESLSHLDDIFFN